MQDNDGVMLLNNSSFRNCFHYCKKKKNTKKEAPELLWKKHMCIQDLTEKDIAFMKEVLFATKMCLKYINMLQKTASYKTHCTNTMHIILLI